MKKPRKSRPISTASQNKKLLRGVTSIEYAALASLIAVAILAGVSATGDANESIWSSWSQKVIAALQGALG